MLKANKNLTYDIVEIDYGQEVNITVAVPKENFEDFKNLVYGLTSSQFEVSIIKEDYHYY